MATVAVLISPITLSLLQTPTEPGTAQEATHRISRSELRSTRALIMIKAVTFMPRVWSLALARWLLLLLSTQVSSIGSRTWLDSRANISFFITMIGAVTRRLPTIVRVVDIPY